MAAGSGSYTEMRTGLQTSGVLTNPNKRKCLGSGTSWTSAQQPCWEIDMNNAKLTPELKQLAEVAELLAQAPVKT